MTVEYLGVDPDGFSASGNEEGTREYRVRHRFRSTADLSDPTAFAALLAACDNEDIAVGGECPYDAGAWVTNLRPSIVKVRNLASAAGARRWDANVDVTYSSKSEDKPDKQKDPTLRIPTITFTSAKFTAPAIANLIPIPNSHPAAYTRLPVVNSAGDPFTRERKRGGLVIKISKTFAKYDPTFVMESPDGFLYTRNAFLWNPIPAAYKNAITGPFNFFDGVASGKARMEDLTITPVWENGEVYIRVDAEVHCDDQKFVDVVNDQGFMFLAPNGTKQRITDRTGAYASTPQLLDGAGHKLAAGADPVPRTFQYYPLAEWGALELP